MASGGSEPGDRREDLVDSQRKVLVVVLELVGGRVEAGPEQVVLVRDGVFKELRGIEAEGMGLELPARTYLLAPPRANPYR